MTYAIRYLRRAREEADAWRTTYGQGFVQAFDQWLVSLAEAAEDGSETTSVDALEILEQAMGEEDQPVTSQWEYSWDRFKSAGGPEKLLALLVLLRKRCPPWEFRMSSNWFALLDCIAVEIQGYYWSFADCPIDLCVVNDRVHRGSFA
ncbi:MAG: hypothetical protein A2V70_02660 [Planctomycetes bacterium RBG_13_63_9]|nr:MAG: hypothetical protein A2V70_02660 [Planctomycetes bacterium RBG_13_63_9]